MVFLLASSVLIIVLGEFECEGPSHKCKASSLLLVTFVSAGRFHSVLGSEHILKREPHPILAITLLKVICPSTVYFWSTRELERREVWSCGQNNYLCTKFLLLRSRKDSQFASRFPRCKFNSEGPKQQQQQTRRVLDCIRFVGTTILTHNLKIRPNKKLTKTLLRFPKRPYRIMSLQISARRLATMSGPTIKRTSAAAKDGAISGPFLKQLSKKNPASPLRMKKAPYDKPVISTEGHYFPGSSRQFATMSEARTGVSKNAKPSATFLKKLSKKSQAPPRASKMPYNKPVIGTDGIYIP